MCIVVHQMIHDELDTPKIKGGVDFIPLFECLVLKAVS